MRKKQPAKVADVLKIKGAAATTTIKPSETIGMLARRLQQERLGAMIVSNDGCKVDGIISERDVAYGVALHKGDLHALPVAALMTKNAVTCTTQDSVADVARVMAERHIRHLPVVDGDRLVGVIGMRDIFMHRLEEMQRMTKILGTFATTGH
jgi:CBS domain-containing protein